MAESGVSSKDNLEDYLLSNQFYVGPSNSQNHITNLRKSVHIPSSVSNTSIHAGLSNDLAGGNNQRTSIMKISPSMKALESILSEKNGSNLAMSSERIVEEEDEDHFQPPHALALSENYTTDDPNRGSTYSVQTFETAHSGSSFSETINMNMNDSPHKSQKSMSTIDDGYNTNDDTPVLVNPAQFQTLTQVNGTGRNSVHPIRVVRESSTEEFDGQSTDVSNRTLYNKEIEQDDTLVGYEDPFKGQKEQQKKEQEYKHEINEQRIQQELEQKQREIRELEKQREDHESIRKKGLSQLEEKKQQEKQHAARTHQVSSLLGPDTGKIILKNEAIESKAPPNAADISSSNPGPFKKSPHTRSNSTFSLSFTKNKEQPPLPGKHKRSSTFGDLSSISKSNEKPSSAKKFSFKNLFKSKPKASKNQEDELVSKPKKLSVKSSSTPNIASFRNDSISTETEKKSSDSKTKINDRVNSTFTSKQQPLPQLPEQTKNGHRPSISSSSSLLNVFKKDKIDKTNDNSSKLVISDHQEQISKKPKTNIIETEDSNPKESNSKESNLKPSFLKKDSQNTVTNSNVNFIREVNDDDYNPNLKYPTPQITQTNFDDVDYDSNAHKKNDTMKPQSLDSGVDDFEYENSKDNKELLHDEKLFGSPFKVDYKPSTMTPKLDNSHGKLASLNHEDKEKAKPEINDQLLGETLFPKSLSVQEVESIVSLERSRSMRSIRSNKRNSFINYNGSDENIIQYNGTGSNSPMESSNISRSNSILKNSSSKRSLNVDNMNSINAQMLNDETTENYDDLIEFTDYIDFDNLDFSVSPKEIAERSPKIILSSPPVLSEKFDQYEQSHGLNIDNAMESQAPGSVDDELETSSIQEILPPPEYLKPLQGPPVILHTPPQSQDDDHNQDFLQNVEVQPDVAIETIDATEPVKGPLTPNLEIINPTQIPESPISINDLSELEDMIEKQDIVDKAYKNSPILNENGKNAMNNRPISMSFRGLKGPSFSGKLAMHDLRSSDSHQSFNMSFGDDDDIDSNLNDAAASEVGGGFGSSDDEDENDDDYYDKFENQENQYRSPAIKHQPVSSKFGQENNFSPLAPPNPLPIFTHNKIPLISSNNSSPKSFSSMISRKFKKTPTLPTNSKVPGKDGVRFSSRIILYDTYNCDEYDRHPDNATCNQLTPALAQQIKDELNEVKSQMPVHELSRCYTHFF